MWILKNINLTGVVGLLFSLEPCIHVHSCVLKQANYRIMEDNRMQYTQGRIQGGAPGARAPPKIFLVKKNRGQPFWNLFEHTGMITTDHL